MVRQRLGTPNLKPLWI